VFFRISGGLFNPAVTLALMLTGAVTYVRGILVIGAQLLGATAASAVVLAILPGPLKVGATLGGGATPIQGMLIEMFLTAQLVFTIFMLAAEKHRATFIAPVGIGLSLFIAELM
jgi:aquaporin rerated protein, other eukaryote